MNMLKGKKSLLFFLIIILFPVIVTLIVGKVNGRNNKEIKSGKTIVIEQEKYSAKMDMDDFILCVLMAQMPVESPMEQLKAQTVVIRTYIINKMGSRSTISTKELKLPFISYTNMEEIWFRQYRIKNAATFGGMIGNLTGLGKSIVFSDNIEYLHTIIEKTNHKVLKYEGKIILPLFHETSNGETRDGESILGSEYSYLKNQKCNTDIETKNFISVKYITLEQFKKNLSKKNIVVYKDKKELFSREDMDLQEIIKNIDYSKKDKSGYTLYLKIGDTVVLAEDFSKAMGLPSTCMEISEYEKGIRITTKGQGHGFGMSMSYAQKLAKDGMSWQKILKTFYNATINDY